MVCTASLFSQLLDLFPRLEFEQMVRRHRGERYAKGFTCWQQFVAMLFAQLASAHSLREVCGGLRCCLGKLVHLGVREAPKRSTLAYANAHRPWEIYQDLFFTLLARVRGIADGRGHRLRFRNPLLSLDSSVIELCLSLFPWADFNRTKGGVKLHCLLDHADYLPTFALVTLATQSDLSVARLLKLPAGSIVVFDKGYKPDDLVNRGQMAVYIARAMVTPSGDAGVPDPPAGDPTFSDVTAENDWSWCHKHVEYLAAEEIVQGYPDGTYHPAAIVTRDQMAVYIQRAFDLPL